MYTTLPYHGLSGLGLSWKPPDWLRNLVGAAVSGTKVTVPTETGIPLTFDLSDPNAMAKLLAMVKGTKISTQVGTPKPSLPQRLNTAVNQLPGGWLTIAGVGLGLVLLPRLLRGR